MTEPATSTVWSRAIPTPWRAFLRTETGSAAVLLAAALAALVWVNADAHSYTRLWDTHLAIRLGSRQLVMDLREWVNSGLMTLFFFVVGLEARREFDLGELRDRRRVTLPLLAGLAGMTVPVLLYLAVTAGASTPAGGASPASGWGTAMSTDTAFALGLLALVGPVFPDRLRAFVLTVVVVDDVVALLVIALVYTGHVDLVPLLVAAGLLLVIVALRVLKVGRGWAYAAVGFGMWLSLWESGVDPVVVGLILGLLTVATPAARTDLEQASEQFRLFREQPTPELARQAQNSVAGALSPNERLQRAYHPWSSYVVVPLFALANTGIDLGGGFVGRAATSPITIGIFVGYVIGKPVGITGCAWLVTAATRGRLRPPVGWAAVGGAGVVAGIGFTVSLLIAGLAFRGEQLDQAKAGVLAAAIVAAVLGRLLFWVTGRLPGPTRARVLLGTSDQLIDLAEPVDPDSDHLRGPRESLVTLVEYGDLECPYCGQAEPVVRELLRDYGEVRYVWRHLPLDDVHPRARLAAEATEAAGVQGAFWEMHDLLIGRQDRLRPVDLVAYAQELGLDVDRFTRDLHEHTFADRVARDVESADLSGVAGTPTFFVNGVRHHGAFDIDSLSLAVREAKASALAANRVERQPA